VTPEAIAHVVHEANRALQLEQNDPTNPVSPAWVDTDAETRESAVAGVAAVQAGATPEQSHEGWCAFKHAHGWTYGVHKDPLARTHPCLVPYDDLPASQQLKDHLFVAIVKTLSR
jgi:RyR domain